MIVTLTLVGLVFILLFLSIRVNIKNSKLSKQLEDCNTTRDELKSLADSRQKSLIQTSAKLAMCTDKSQFVRNIFPNRFRLSRLTEVQLVELAANIGVQASVDDLKKDTIEAIAVKLGLES